MYTLALTAKYLALNPHKHFTSNSSKNQHWCQIYNGQKHYIRQHFWNKKLSNHKFRIEYPKCMDILEMCYIIHYLGEIQTLRASI